MERPGMERGSPLRHVRLSHGSPEKCNYVWLVFTDADYRTRLHDWESQAKALVARFRAEADGYASDPWLGSFVERLSIVSPEFARWWPLHEVTGERSRIKVLSGAVGRPDAGELVFEHTVFSVADQPVNCPPFLPLLSGSSRPGNGELRGWCGNPDELIGVRPLQVILREHADAAFGAAHVGEEPLFLVEAQRARGHRELWGVPGRHFASGEIKRGDRSRGTSRETARDSVAIHTISAYKACHIGIGNGAQLVMS